MNQIHQSVRQRVWSDAWAAVASAFNCKRPSDATKWADAALEEFDKRFPEPDGPYKQTKIGFNQK